MFGRNLNVTFPLNKLLLSFDKIASLYSYQERLGTSFWGIINNIHGYISEKNVCISTMHLLTDTGIDVQ